MNTTTQTKDIKKITGRPPEFQYLEQLILFRLNHYFGLDPGGTELPSFPTFKEWSLHLPDFIKKNLGKEEATLLLISLAPHIQPDLFDSVIENRLQQSGDFREIGGVRGKNFRGLLPTGETALFLLAGNDFEKCLKIKSLFDENHLFAQQQVLWLEEMPVGEPAMSGKIILSQEYVDFFIKGAFSKPRFGINFPAQRLETLQEWHDLVLSQETKKQIEELEMWVKWGDALRQEWDMARKTKPGYRVLFHGPPGTGKTLTASLLGKYTGKDVYKIDLSMVVSKFIGETEKNLASLFDRAENKDWILFFDEADALFGKRTSVRDAHDKYANQEVSYLLQRTENYNGLVILATNFKSNIDDAFSRRFQSHIYFPVPGYAERLQLWQKALPEKVAVDEGVDFTSLARQYELTGAHISNIVHYACLMAIARKEKWVRLNDFIEGIRKEYGKEGKII